MAETDDSQNQQFCLRWNNYSTNLTSAFEALWSGEDFLDVTLAVEGKTLKAHKMILSACSSYFKNLLKDNPCRHPIIILHDITHDELKALIHFMYNGEVNVPQENIPRLLQAADMLKIRGLSTVPNNGMAKQMPSIPDAMPFTPSSDIPNTDRSLSPKPKRRKRAPPSLHAINNSRRPSSEKLCEKSNIEDRYEASGTRPSVAALRRKEEEEREKENKHPENDIGNGNISLATGDFSDEERDLVMNIEEVQIKTEVEDHIDGNSNSIESESAMSSDFPSTKSSTVYENGFLSAASKLKELSFLSQRDQNATPNINPIAQALLSTTTSPGSSFSPGGCSPLLLAGLQVELGEDLVGRRLAFHEPRPCPQCRRIYRDAATLRTHIAIMHSEASEPFSCSCGSLFRTKHEMYTHKKNGHQ